MNVSDIMTPQPSSCAPDTSVAAAARLMWEADCGILPVVDGGRVVGIVTDRDMYIALATRNRLASELPVGEVATRPVITCRTDDDVHEALGLMQRALVRRLPVLDSQGALVGIISTDDLVRVAGPRKAVTGDDVLQVLQALVGHHVPAAVN
jgi:CBS domain-containing protein